MSSPMTLSPAEEFSAWTLLTQQPFRSQHHLSLDSAPEIPYCPGHISRWQKRMVDIFSQERSSVRSCDENGCKDFQGRSAPTRRRISGVACS
jgi:hypothetical protein